MTAIVLLWVSCLMVRRRVRVINKPNRRSIRLHGYDYSQQGLYYITVCTQDRLRLFGEVINGEVMLNEVGRIVEIELKKTEQIRDNMRLDEFIIMPNHIHFIVEIKCRGVLHTPASTTNTTTGVFDTPLRSPSNNLGSIVRGFKSAVTKWCRLHTDIYDVWQRNYYEHIIRDGNDYARIAEYIQDNPTNWAEDEYNV